MKKDITVIDNFLPDDLFKKIKSLFVNTGEQKPTLSYTLNEGINLTGDDEGYQFVCVIYNENEPSYDISLNVMDDISKYLESNGFLVCTWKRLKVNILPNNGTHIVHGMHVDGKGDSPFKCVDNYANQYNAVFYLNSTDAPTYFEDGTKIECVENRIAIFKNTMLHASSTPTDSPYRMVMNLNWY